MENANIAGRNGAADTAAVLHAELARARNALSTAEQCFLEAARGVAEGEQQVPADVRWHVGFHRRRIAALERAVSELAARRMEAPRSRPAGA